VPDQLVDRTSGREHTFVREGVNHVTFADPYCTDGRASVLKVGNNLAGMSIVDGGTMVVIDGPRFSTRAESRWYAAAGFTLINMTGQPEAALARELALCYTAVALVTDLDAGVDADTAVSQDKALEVFRTNSALMRALLLETVPALPASQHCSCQSALDGLSLDHGLRALSSLDRSRLVT
jgi:5'-methylthioadenosine phosphorylase